MNSAKNKTTEVDRFAKRREQLLARLAKEKLEHFLVSNPTNVSYLTGFTGDDSCLVVGKDLAVLVSDGRYETQIQLECPDLASFIRKPSETIVNAIAQVLKKGKLKRIGFEGHVTTVDEQQRLQSETKSLDAVPLTGIVEELRMVKDAGEVDEIRKAIRQAERGGEFLRAMLTGEMTELQASHELEHAIRRFGGRGVSFEPIVAVGPHSALPHARPTKTRIDEADFVLIDWGSNDLGGYKSDLTRLWATSKISTKLKKLYRVVLKAQEAAIGKIKAGVIGSDVDQAARTVIEKAGYGKQFTHSLGHGIGLDIHEGPRLSPGSETVLKPGMVVTVEPGIYLPGVGWHSHRRRRVGHPKRMRDFVNNTEKPGFDCGRLADSST